MEHVTGLKNKRIDQLTSLEAQAHRDIMEMEDGWEQRLDKVLTILRIPVGEGCLTEIDAIPGNTDDAEHIELEEPTTAYSSTDPSTQSTAYVEYETRFFESSQEAALFDHSSTAYSVLEPTTAYNPEVPMRTYNYGPGYRQSMGNQLQTDATYNNFDWVPASNLYANQYMPHTAAYDWPSQSVNQPQPVPSPESTRQVESFGTPEASTFTFPSVRNSRDLNKLLRMDCFYELCPPPPLLLDVGPGTAGYERMLKRFQKNTGIDIKDRVACKKFTDGIDEWVKENEAVHLELGRLASQPQLIQSPEATKQFPSEASTSVSSSPQMVKNRREIRNLIRMDSMLHGKALSPPNIDNITEMATYKRTVKAFKVNTGIDVNDRAAVAEWVKTNSNFKLG